MYQTEKDMCIKRENRCTKERDICIKRKDI